MRGIFPDLAQVLFKIIRMLRVFIFSRRASNEQKTHNWKNRGNHPPNTVSQQECSRCGATIYLRKCMKTIERSYIEESGKMMSCRFLWGFLNRSTPGMKNFFSRVLLLPTGTESNKIYDLQQIKQRPLLKPDLFCRLGKVVISQKKHFQKISGYRRLWMLKSYLDDLEKDRALVEKRKAG